MVESVREGGSAVRKAGPRRQGLACASMHRAESLARPTTAVVIELAVQLVGARLGALWFDGCLPVVALKMCVSRYRQALSPG
ncbi:hypothetical protein [Kitasatospora sp. NPDC058478]|uniref:hypothetical protein n=1 Tax=unclassified Kitasatospora TaxID=2633591 RepID=UPI00365FEAEB